MFTNLKSRPVRAKRGGLTLIELVVVMTILIALAGLLVPMFASMLTRGHTSTCSTNMGEVAKAIGQYQMLYDAYPSNLDSLTSGGASGTLINYLANGAGLPAQYGGPGTTTTMAGGQITLLTLTAAEISAMQNAGLSTFQSMAPAYLAPTTGFDPTFNYYADYASPGTTANNAFTIPTNATTYQMAGLDPINNSAATIVCNHLNWPITGRYLVVGVGPRCSMIGSTMASAPVHYGDAPVLNPEYGYQRICAIFKVSDTAANNFTTAQFVGAAPLHDNGVGSIGDELQNWYQLEGNGS